jgi:hypothetical protein
MQWAGALRYVGPPRPGPLLNRPLGDKCSKQGSRLKLTVVRRNPAGQGARPIIKCRGPTETGRAAEEQEDPTNYSSKSSKSFLSTPFLRRTRGFSAPALARVLIAGSTGSSPRSLWSEIRLQGSRRGREGTCGGLRVSLPRPAFVQRGRRSPAASCRVQEGLSFSYRCTGSTHSDRCSVAVDARGSYDAARQTKD